MTSNRNTIAHVSIALDKIIAPRNAREAFTAAERAWFSRPLNQEVTRRA